MNRLSLEISLYIQDYLYYDDKVAFSSCCSNWYTEILRNYIRILRVRMGKWSSKQKFKELKRVVFHMIKLPSQQLEIHLDADLCDQSIYAYELLEFTNFAVKSLTCSILHILEFININRTVLVHLRGFNCYDPYEEIRLENQQPSQYDYVSALSHVDTSYLKELGISCDVNIESYWSQVSLSNLQQLYLYDCEISDVSVLGIIPELTIQRCNKIVDISALNLNRKIEISDCTGISDYSLSFQSTEEIELKIPYNPQLIFDFHQWRKVKKLNIKFSRRMALTNNNIPETVRECYLHGVNCSFFISHFHTLRTLVIHNNDSLTSLQDIGLEKVTVIELSNVYELLSLKGLGSGRNRKIIVNICPRITDYSPVRYVHEVQILNSTATVKLDELDHVHILTIVAKELVVDSRKSYDDIFELNVAIDKLNPSFSGLERIPVVGMDLRGISHLSTFLMNEGQLWNQKLLLYYPLRSGPIEAFYKTFFEEYLQKEYSFDRILKDYVKLTRKDACEATQLSFIKG